MQTVKLFFAAAAFCAATFLGYNTYKTATMTEQERLIQANIDALSDPEGSAYDNWVSYDLDCSCGGTRPSCMWSYDGSGDNCTPGSCANCGTDGVYFYFS